MTIYYTYLIGWTKTNKFYYGVRYAKDSHPSDLFITYFTSSKHVKAYRKKHGNPDIIQIRKTFVERDKAIEWEHNVLRRMNLKEHKNFLNATNICAPPVKEFDRGANFAKWNAMPYNEKYSKEKRKEISKMRRQAALLQHAEGRANYTKPSDTSNYVKAANKRWANSEFKRKAKSRKWYYNPITRQTKMFLPEEIAENWVQGRG